MSTRNFSVSSRCQDNLIQRDLSNYYQRNTARTFTLNFYAQIKRARRILISRALRRIWLHRSFLSHQSWKEHPIHSKPHKGQILNPFLTKCRKKIIKTIKLQFSQDKSQSKQYPNPSAPKLLKTSHFSPSAVSISYKSCPTCSHRELQPCSLHLGK